MIQLYELTIFSVLCGFIIDFFIGDPAFLPHPVMLIGKLISLFEKLLRRIFPETKGGERAGGIILAILVPLITAGVTFAALYLCYRINKWVYFGLSCIMCWQIFAARCLQKEAEKVVKALKKDGIDAGRKQVSMLVGRDTENLTEEQVIKATVETVAENTTDGVISPLIFMMLFGAVGGFFYKSINTMDSMVGYKNDRYVYFGTAAARLDDAANFISARLAAIFMIISAFLLGFDGKGAARIWKRDRYKHASPNSAQTESVCAGALGIRLGGSASYFGKVHEKPTIGDSKRSIEPQDAKKACSLMYMTSIILLALTQLLAWGAMYIGGNL